MSWDQIFPTIRYLITQQLALLHTVAISYCSSLFRSQLGHWQRAFWDGLLLFMPLSVSWTSWCDSGEEKMAEVTGTFPTLPTVWEASCPVEMLSDWGEGSSQQPVRNWLLSVTQNWVLHQLSLQMRGQPWPVAVVPTTGPMKGLQPEGTWLSHTWIPDPKKLWDNKRFLVKQLCFC